MVFEMCNVRSLLVTDTRVGESLVKRLNIVQRDLHPPAILLGLCGLDALEKNKF